MKSFQNLDRPKLQNEEYFQLAREAERIFDQAFSQHLLGKVELYWYRYRELVRLLDIALEKIRKSALTDPLVGLDVNRDGLLRGIGGITKAHQHSVREELIEASRKLTIVLNHYGDLTKQNYNKQTASVYNLLQEFRENYASEIATLHLQDWVEDLEKYNKEVETIINERYDENLGNESGNVREIRLEMDGVYSQITKIIDAAYLMDEDPVFGTLIEQMNERIAYYKNTIATRKGRAKAKKEKEEENNG